MQALASKVLKFHCSVLKAQVSASLLRKRKHGKGIEFSLHTFFFERKYAPLAQLVEQLTLNQWVPGSNP